MTPAEAASSAKLVIVVGTSITVQPAALIPTLCRQSGGSLIVCNKDDSGQEMADVFLQVSWAFITHTL